MKSFYNTETIVSTERVVTKLLEREKTLLRITNKLMRAQEAKQRQTLLDEAWQVEAFRLMAINVDVADKHNNLDLIEIENDTFEHRDAEMKELVGAWATFTEKFDVHSISSSTECDTETVCSGFSDFGSEFLEAVSQSGCDNSDYRKEAARLRFIHAIPVKHTTYQSFYQAEVALFNRILLEDDKAQIFLEECNRLCAIVVDPPLKCKEYKAVRCLRTLCPLTSSNEVIQKRALEAVKAESFDIEWSRFCALQVFDDDESKADLAREAKESRRLQVLSSIITSSMDIKARAEEVRPSFEAESKVFLAILREVECLEKDNERTWLDEGIVDNPPSHLRTSLIHPRALSRFKTEEALKEGGNSESVAFDAVVTQDEALPFAPTIYGESYWLETASETMNDLIEEIGNEVSEMLREGWKCCMDAFYLF